MPGIAIRHTGDGRCLYGYWLEQDGQSLLSELGTFGRIAHAQAAAAVLAENGLGAAARYTAASGYMDPIYQSFAARRQPTPNQA